MDFRSTNDKNIFDTCKILFVSVRMMNQLHVLTISTNWKEADQNAYSNHNNVQLWRINITNQISNLRSLQVILEPAEISKIQRYQHEKDRQTRIISRAILRILLGRYLSVDPAEIRFNLDNHKKPVLRKFNSVNIHFNVSHSGDWILIGIAPAPIGVDLEQINASFIDQNLLDYSFSLSEKEVIQAAINPATAFYQLWTKKEALLKATGKGLIDDLPQVPSLDGIHKSPGLIIGSNENWQIVSFKVDENHTGSAAFIPVKTMLQFFNFQL
ncbi:MAG: 4'-phosphopantetheinyl transferase superfamily protein [Sphingobacteriaceae bacterium]|nr:MAG: 4'-phosphopantetheinyl transferase superfamily protein [Sphingobacteriaceae bacterium]